MGLAARIYDATWGRGFAAIYDRGLKATEDAGLRQMRRETLGQARGRTLDIGAGTGVNAGLFPPAVSELVLVEPDPHMFKKLQVKLEGSGEGVSSIEAPAEQLPFADGSADTVVFTLVLCTVPDPAAALAEAARVLRPGGKLLFVEHVRSQHPDLARWQDRLEKPWRFLADGCHCNRDTVATIEASPFELEQVEHDRLPKAAPIVRPLARGSARLAA
ncbi:MAG TPA: class I SAM-dependent methyltransferase [Solirubrobacterales bacterium]|jgi:ubiquinone/menaquinone biosynthesis C-methylase UbiE|nr:class I SAM-dependent methyltransferase [Solirubrobacterales bacterium]